MLHVCKNYSKNPDYVRIFALHLSKAFDRLPRDQVVEKLKELMTNHLHIVNVLTDFPRNRTPNVDINNKQSKVQGQVAVFPIDPYLSRIMFNLFYDELQSSEATGHLIYYADNITSHILGNFNEHDKTDAALVELTTWRESTI